MTARHGLVRWLMLGIAAEAVADGDPLVMSALMFLRLIRSMTIVEMGTGVSGASAAAVNHRLPVEAAGAPAHHGQQDSFGYGFYTPRRWRRL
jgi:precorrin-6B methylase 1